MKNSKYVQEKSQSQNIAHQWHQEEKVNKLWWTVHMLQTNEKQISQFPFPQRCDNNSRQDPPKHKNKTHYETRL